MKAGVCRQRWFPDNSERYDRYRAVIRFLIFLQAWGGLKQSRLSTTYRLWAAGFIFPAMFNLPDERVIVTPSINMDKINAENNFFISYSPYPYEIPTHKSICF